MNNSALGDGECILPAGHSVNPLRLQDSFTLDGFDILQPASRPSANEHFNNYTNHVRVTRDTEKVVNTRTIIDKDGRRHRVVTMVRSTVSCQL